MTGDSSRRELEIEYGKQIVAQSLTVWNGLTKDEEAVRLDWLQPTVRYGCERHAVISVVPEASSRQYSVCHRIRKFDLGICRGLHGLGEYGFASAPARSWDRGARCFVRRFMLGLDEAAACFWRVDDWRISLQENGTSKMSRRS